MPNVTEMTYEMKQPLADFMDEEGYADADEEVTAGEALKAIWDYANNNDLKVSVPGKRGGHIKPDSALRPILGSKVVGAGQIMKAIHKNFYKD